MAHTAAIRRIGVFTLSNAADPDALNRGADALREEFGCEVDLSACITTPGPRKLAGDDRRRADAFRKLVSDPAIDFLMAARGGYGVTRVLEMLDFEEIRRSGKTLCGYSDVTALLMTAWKSGCRRLLHGPMLASCWGEDPDTPAARAEMAVFRKLLCGEWSLFSPENPPVILKEGRAEGPLIPVNLTLLTALLGTPYLPELAGTILALEDVNLPAHALDRALCQLRSAGILSRLAGLVFGQFTHADDASCIPEILREYASWVPGPSAMGCRLGHGHPSIFLPFGETARISLSKDSPYALS